MPMTNGPPMGDGLQSGSRNGPASAGMMGRNGSLGGASSGAGSDGSMLSPPHSAMRFNGGFTATSNSMASEPGNSGTASDAHRMRRPRPDTEEIKRVGRIHYQELLTFLRSHLAKGQNGPRSNAREKLTRLSKQQFTELSTDVYDELMRRLDKSGNDMPHLAVRDEFHPKRNQARQKLSTLPKTRFKDLSSDVFFELERRFPELRDEFRPDAAEREREEKARVDAEAGAAERSRAPPISAQPSTADVIIPAKSTLVSEDIPLPYSPGGGGRPPDDETSGDTGPRPKKGHSSSYTDHSRDSLASNRDLNGAPDNRSTMYSQASSVGTGFLNGYAGSRATESVASPNLQSSATFGIEKLRSDYEFRIATLNQRVGALETENAELKEEAESTASSARGKLLEVNEHRDRAKNLEKELDGLRERHRTLEEQHRQHKHLHEEKHTQLEQTLKALDDLQREHEDLQHEHERQRVASGTGNAAELSEQLDELQRDYAHQEDLVNELRSEVTSLLDEIRQLSTRNDEMMAEKESDLVVVRDLNNQMQSYKRKYETAKTELRALKATSQLFVQPPKADEVMPSTEGGAIADVNLTAFQSSIDELLSAARSKTPGNVLLSMKTVVLASTLVTDDVVRWEAASGGELGPDEREQLGLLKSKASSTLNNLMTACRNHASSQGMSPVSLLDAAASHVSTTIVDLAKLLKVRKASQAETEELEATFAQGSLPNGLRPLHINALAQSNSREAPFSPTTGAPISEFRARPSLDDRLQPSAANAPSPRTRSGPVMGRYSPVGYRPDIGRKNSQGEGSWQGSRQRTASSSSNSSNAGASANIPAVPPITQEMRQKSYASSTRPSSAANTSAPPSPAALGRSPSGSTQAQTPPSGPLDDSEENWAELRNYIEVQTESIVHAIQSLLSAIREGATGVQLSENLEQITTIVSSIVAISKDNLPTGPRAAEGERILAALLSDCEKLSEMQSKPVFDKATKRTMASASYGVAKGLKALNSLLSPLD
ncbi:SPA2 PROTEIN [Ceraceosorus bombacis]|uniref:SPA2 PROTEIN n=1 Tax=Ceraceosorus bombacis TaxID=401625 RepID=A0A0P1B7K5_9BASI|nr:SPA2 PROTEIN [Ceraceosorus bombacis]